MLLEVLLTNFLFFIPVTADRYCFDCRGNSNLASCSKITLCGPHEECYIEETIADDGVVFFQQGCRDRLMCGKGVNSLLGLGKRVLTTVCNECCDKDYCNYKGCGNAGISPENFNHLCLNCGNSRLDGPNKCHSVGLCQPSEKCSVRRTRDLNGNTAYQFGCKQESACLDLGTQDQCNKCCTGPFCNAQCTSGGSGIGSVQVPNNPVTTTAPPTILVRPANTTACFTCNHITRTTDCEDFTHCGPHEQCFVEKAITSDGNVLISSGCSPKSSCYSLSGGGMNTVVCHQCCQKDYCNINGCGTTVNPTDESRFCITCKGAKHLTDCNKITECTADQFCMIKHSRDLNGQPTIDMGCAPKTMCDILQRSDASKCSGCCSGPYCNKDCDTFDKHRIVSYLPTTTSTVIPTTYPETTPSATTVPSTDTTISITTALDRGYFCYSCEFVRSTTVCRNMVLCQKGQVCQLKELTGSNGDIAYRLRCENKETCNNGGRHTRVGCCSGDLCNKSTDILS